MKTECTGCDDAKKLIDDNLDKIMYQLATTGKTELNCFDTSTSCLVCEKWHTLGYRGIDLLTQENADMQELVRIANGNITGEINE